MTLAKKGTLFVAWTIFSGAATKKKKKGAAEQLRLSNKSGQRSSIKGLYLEVDEKLGCHNIKNSRPVQVDSLWAGEQAFRIRKTKYEGLPPAIYFVQNPKSPKSSRWRVPGDVVSVFLARFAR